MYYENIKQLFEKNVINRNNHFKLNLICHGKRQFNVTRRLGIAHIDFHVSALGLEYFLQI